MTELDRLKRIKNKAKACVRGAKRICGLECSDTEMKVPPCLMDALEKEIERYEKSLKEERPARRVPKTKLGTVRVRRCADCTTRCRCTWMICPCEAELGGETDPARAMWLCEDC